MEFAHGARVSGRAQFRCSIGASAALQLACLTFVLSAFPISRAVQTAQPVARQREFRVTRILYSLRLPSVLASNKIGGLTGLSTAPKTALSHPTVPRATTPKQLPAPPDLGNWSSSPISMGILRTPVPKPALPVAEGMPTNITHRAGRLLNTKQVQVGSFSSPALLSDDDRPGLTSHRHNGENAAEFGDGFGNGGGQVFQPVRILEKPLPQYTPEARRRKIQGEVHLVVVFHADRSVEVLQMNQGLGFGLDEAAIDAVEHIRFVPASVNGKSIDFKARVRAVFSLLQAPSTRFGSP